MRTSHASSLVALSFALSACGAGGGDAEPNDETNDETSADAGAPDADENDGDAGDTNGGGGDDDAGAGADAADDGACDPEAVAAELVGRHEDVTAATASFEALEPGHRLVIDASAGGLQASQEASYVYVDLGAPEVLALSDAEALTNFDWDIALKRTLIRVNSGNSGPGGVMLTSVSETTWDDALPPGRDAQWKRDDFIDENCEPITYGQGFLQSAFADWYDYDFETHAVSAPDDVVYFVYDIATHKVTKLQIEDYDEGTYTIRWE